MTVRNLKEEYTRHQRKIKSLNYQEAVRYIIDTFTGVWQDEYLDRGNGISNLCSIKHGDFEYYYDDLDTLQQIGAEDVDPSWESRVVVAFGISSNAKRKRDDSRLRGWVGPTSERFGSDWNKGHLIAHRIGGAVDGMELNVFQQRRDMNMGISAEGKIFSSMEEYCYRNPGSFCFSRPIYSDHTSKPCMLEYGVLKTDNQLWVECFSNA